MAIELLTTKDGLSGIPGFRTEVADLRSKTTSGSFWYNLPYYIAALLNVLAKIAVILATGILISLYYWYGRERAFTVPEYLSTISNPGSNPGRWTSCSKVMLLTLMKMAIMQLCWNCTGEK